MKRKYLDINNYEKCKKLKIEMQNSERTIRLINRNKKKRELEFNKLYSNIIQQKIKILKNILNIYKKYSELKINNICEVLCKTKCKKGCIPKILTFREIRSIVKMQILTEKPYKILIKEKYNEYTHMILCLRIFIKWYFDEHIYLHEFSKKMCKYNKLEAPNWLAHEYLICKEINWNFTNFY